MVYNNMGQALQEEGKLEEAIAWYAQAIRRQPGTARFHTNLGSVLVEQEHYEEGLAQYQEALRLDPQYAEAHNRLGFLHHEQGRYEVAKSWYQQAIGLKPDLAAAHCNLGTVQEEMGDFDTALAAFREVLRHDPRHTGARAALANSLRGKLPEPDLRPCTSCSPTRSSARASAAACIMGWPRRSMPGATTRQPPSIWPGPTRWI